MLKSIEREWLEIVVEDISAINSENAITEEKIRLPLLCAWCCHTCKYVVNRAALPIVYNCIHYNVQHNF